MTTFPAVADPDSTDEHAPPPRSAHPSVRSRGAVAMARAAAVAAILFIVLFWRLGAVSFWDPDEAHYAETTRELIATGDWWVPYYNGQPFFDKPVLFHQLQAAAMLAFGQNEFGARFVPAVAALALVLVTFWVGRALVSADVGLIAALLLATSPGIFGLARYAILDTVFAAFLFGGVSLLAVAALRNRPALQYAGYVLVAFAVLTKGPVALVLCGLTLLGAIAVSSRLRQRLLGLHWIAGLAIVLAIAAPWFVYMYSRFGVAFVNGYVLDENIRLYATSRFGGQPDRWFYLRILAVGLLPWTGIVIGRFVDDARAIAARRARDEAELLLWAWTIAVVGFFTFSRFKLDHYVFPAAPALCLLSARAWTDVCDEPRAREHAGARLGLGLVGPLLVAVGAAAGYFLIARLDMPASAVLVPALVAVAGVVITARTALGGGRPSRVPWLAAAAVTVTYAGVVLFVMPALEVRKVVPDVARWVAERADAPVRVAAYRLNRWNTAFRFYVDRHTAVLETPEEAVAFFDQPEPFYCVMLGPAFEEFVARGVPLRRVYAREGMWATSGRALWRRRLPPTRFVVATRS